MNYGVIARILLRYGAGALVALGALSPEFADMIAMDPDLISIVGLGLAALVEGAYAFAKRKGWAT